MSIGPVALLAGLISVPGYYLTYRLAPEPKRELTVARYVVATFVVGVLAYVAGATVGIAVACSSAAAGNLCGLVGVFGVGPLLSGVGIFVYARSAVKTARRAP